MAQVTAAALVSELKTLAHPASADTIPTSANREDHVSMSMARRAEGERALELARRVIAIEMLLACQAIDLLAPLDHVAGARAGARARALARADARLTTARRRPTSSAISGADRERRTRTRVRRGSQVKNFC